MECLGHKNFSGKFGEIWAKIFRTNSFSLKGFIFLWVIIRYEIEFVAMGEPERQVHEALQQSNNRDHSAVPAT